MNSISVISYIKKTLEHACQQLGLPPVSIVLEHPKESSHGDYTSTIALSLFNQVKDRYQNPRLLAEALKINIEADPEMKTWLVGVEVAGLGFLNFRLNSQILVQELDVIREFSDTYGTNQSQQGKKVLCEFTDPNPFKEFHIGHLYSNAVGEALSRIIAAQGATVKRANYFGDVGMHVAKSIYGMQVKMAEEHKTLEDLEKETLPFRVKFLGEAYALGTKAYESNTEAAQKIKDLNKLIYEQDQSIIQLYQTGKRWSLDYFETMYQRLGTKFDFYFPESEVGPLGLQFVRQQLEKGVFEQSDGAVIFPGEKYGLHTRVFINQQNLPTYEAKDLGLAPIKYQHFPYDTSIIITANEINEYFKVILKALEMIDASLAKKTIHIGHGVVRLPEGKMSSRTGKVITGSWLLDYVKQEAINRIKQEEASYSEDEVDAISEQVTIGAIKYAFLKSNIGQDIIFDINTSLSLEGNSGPYIQYTYARCQSVIHKSKIKIETLRTDFNTYEFQLEELEVLRYLYRFPEVVEQAGKDLAPHLICTYLYELCQLFNSFYNKYRILQAEQPEQINFRLLLTYCVAQVLHNGLNLLGIPIPQKM